MQKRGVEDDEDITNYIAYEKERREDDEDVTNYITYAKERIEDDEDIQNSGEKMTKTSLTT